MNGGEQGSMDFPYIYTGDRQARNGQPCKLLVRGNRNSCMVEFEDGNNGDPPERPMRQKGTYEEVRNRSTTRCTACEVSLARIPHAQCLPASWAKLAQDHELLCTKCFFQRASEHNLTPADLTPCPFNLFHRSYSCLSR
jgi:hypothetical protein